MTSRTRKLAVIALGVAVVVVVVLVVSREPMRPVGLKFIRYDFAQNPVIQITNHNGFAIIYRWPEQRTQIHLGPHEAHELPVNLGFEFSSAATITLNCWREPTSLQRRITALAHAVGIEMHLKTSPTTLDLPLPQHPPSP